MAFLSSLWRYCLANRGQASGQAWVRLLTRLLTRLGSGFWSGFQAWPVLGQALDQAWRSLTRHCTRASVHSCIRVGEKVTELFCDIYRSIKINVFFFVKLWQLYFIFCVVCSFVSALFSAMLSLTSWVTYLLNTLDISVQVLLQRKVSEVSATILQQARGGEKWPSKQI